MRLADVAEADFAAELAKREKMTVDEWQGITVYWGPWTLADVDAVFGPGAPVTVNGRLARTIVTKARDEHGKPLFVQPEEQQLLAGARPAAVVRLGSAMIATMPTADSQADIEKK